MPSPFFWWLKTTGPARGGRRILGGDIGIPPQSPQARRHLYRRGTLL